MARATVSFNGIGWQSLTGRGLPIAEKVLVVIGFVILFGTFRALLLSGGRSDGSALFQLVAGSVYALSAVILLFRGTSVWVFRMLLRSWPMVLFSLLPLISTAWSQDPGSTLRRSIALLLCVCFAVYLVARVHHRTLFDLMAVAFAIFCVVGVLAVLVPGKGITPNGPYVGAWQGFTANKNEFGRTVGLCVAFAPCFALISGSVWRTWGLPIFFFALGLLALSRSATSLVAAFGGLGIGGVVYMLLGGRLQNIRLRLELRIILAVAVTAIAALMISAVIPLVLELLGRDPTLSGRTKLWQWAIATNSQREWFGSGYRAFWIDDNTKYFFEFFGWRKDPDGEQSDSYGGPTHGHSGYVDLWLELGMLGAVSFAALIVTALRHLRQTLKQGNWEIGLPFAVVIVFMLLYAFTAKSILQQSEDLWFLFTVFYFYSARDSIRMPRRAIYSVASIDQTTNVSRVGV